MMPSEEHMIEILTQKISSISTDISNNEDQKPVAILTAKAVSMVVLGTVSICVGLIPLQISRCLKLSSSDKLSNPKSLKIIGILLGFGGGVLLSTTFIHMLPELQENVDILIADGILPTVTFPLAETFVCFGFFMMYLVEELVHSKLRHQQNKCMENLEKNIHRSTNELVETGQVSHSIQEHSHSHGHSHLSTALSNDQQELTLASFRGLLIVLGLSVHELFEGLAIGLESSAGNVWYMFGAVAVHKFVIAFCIGIELIATRSNYWLCVGYICIFAIVSPAGIGIGMCLTGGEQAVTGGPLPIILQGIATGTLLYVVFFEILQRHRDGLHQYLSILVGFAVMFGLQIAKMENSEILSTTSQTTQITLFLTKIGVMIVLGLGSFGLGMLPLAIGHYSLTRRKKSVLAKISIGLTTNSSSADASLQGNEISKEKFSDQLQGLLTSLLLCFGGGVLLFTTFLHLAPEVRQSIERHQSAGQFFTLGTLSMAELLFCLGFFLVYFVEETVHATLSNKLGTSQNFLFRTVSVHRYNKQVKTSISAVTISTATSANNLLPTNLKSSQFQYKNEENVDINNLSEWTSDHQNSIKNQKLSSTIFIQPLQTVNAPVESALENDRFVTPQNNVLSEQLQTCRNNNPGNSVGGLLTVVALSFHAIFEGLAVGLEPAVSSVLYLAAAIATHKLVIAFCIGLELYVADTPKKIILGYLSVLSMVTPLGIMIGIALSYFKNETENLGPIPTILQGMAAGTLLYVVFFEVLARERANEKSGLLQLAAILLGFMLMLGLQLVTSHAHTHSHGHSHGHVHGEEHNLMDSSSDGTINKHVNVISDTMQELSSAVTEVVTTGYLTSSTESAVLKKTQ